MVALMRICIMALTFLFLSCAGSRNNGAKGSVLHSYEVSQVFPLMKVPAILVGYDTPTIYVHYLDDLILYHLAYKYTYNDEPQVRRYHYMVQKINDTVGINYDEHKSPEGRRVTIDSFFRNQWIVQNNLYPAFTNPDVYFRRSIIALNSDSTKEKVVFYNRTDSALLRTGYLTYKYNFDKVNISLSKELDSLKGMKLVHAKFENYRQPYKSTGIMIDPFNQEFFLKKVNAADKQKILGYFERFKRDIKL